MIGRNSAHQAHAKVKDEKRRQPVLDERPLAAVGEHQREERRREHVHERYADARLHEARRVELRQIKVHDDA